VEVGEAAHDVGFAEASVTDGDGEEEAGVEFGSGHGEVLSLAEGAGWVEESGDLAGEVAEESMHFPEAFAHLLDGLDAHVFEGAVEEHIAVEAGGMVTDFGEDVFVTEHDEGGDRLSNAGKSSRMSRFF
jgi:hypothetical protein